MTYESILNRMLERIPNTFDKREGSVIWLALAPAAAELAQMYIEHEYTINETYADTASYENLKRRAAERGVYPFEATNAILKAEFDKEIVPGERFLKEDLSYIVLSKIEGEEFAYEIMCEQKGTKGNQYFGTIIPANYIDGLTKAEITELLIPARDLEDVETFRERYYDSFNAEAFGGNKKDYENKTLSLDGVGSVRVIPIWNGGGTVKLIILDSTLSKASNKLIETVQNEIDPVGHSGLGMGLAPIGHVVTVVTPKDTKINIKSNILLDVGHTWNTIKPQIKESINKYFLELRKEWSTLENTGVIVRTAYIENKILNVPGVLDISGTTINGSKENIHLAVEELPVVGDIINES